LPPERQNRDAAFELGAEIKSSIRCRVGEEMTCSIGVGPNVFLAKVAADMQKPDGFTFLGDSYPQQLMPLPLTDFPGIGSHMLKRLHNAQIRSVPDLLACGPEELENVWKSVRGRDFYFMLRGWEDYDYGTVSHKSAASLSRSYVLSPEQRNPRDA